MSNIRAYYHRLLSGIMALVMLFSFMPTAYAVTPEEPAALTEPAMDAATPLEVYIPEDTEVTPVPEEPEVTPVPEEPEVTPVPEEPEVTPVPEEPEVTPVPEEPEVTPVPEEPEVTPVPEEPEVTPVPEEPEVTPTPEVSFATSSVLEEPSVNRDIKIVIEGGTLSQLNFELEPVYNGQSIAQDSPLIPGATFELRVSLPDGVTLKECGGFTMDISHSPCFTYVKETRSAVFQSSAMIFLVNDAAEDDESSTRVVFLAKPTGSSNNAAQPDPLSGHLFTLYYTADTAKLKTADFNEHAFTLTVDSISDHEGKADNIITATDSSALWLAPHVPQGLKVTPGGNYHTAHLTWQPVSGIDDENEVEHYGVFRSEAGGELAQIATVSSASYTDAKCYKPEIKYTYHVRAINNDIKSQASAAVTITTGRASMDVNGVTSGTYNGMVTEGGSALEVTFPVIPGVTEYRLVRYTSMASALTNDPAKGQLIATATASEGQDTLTVTDDSVTAGATYFYQVYPYYTNHLNRLVYGLPVGSSALIRHQVPLPTGPAPSITSVTTDGITLSWDIDEAEYLTAANRPATPSGMEIYRRTTSGAWEVIASITNAAGPWTDTEADPGSSYYYALRPVMESGEIWADSPATAGSVACGDSFKLYGVTGPFAGPVKAPATNPATLTDLQAARVSTQSNAYALTLTWEADGTPDGYNVYRKAANAAGTGTLLAATAGKSYTDSSIQPGAKYTYTIAPYTTLPGGAQEEGPALYVTTELPVLPAPVISTPSSTADSITLSWNSQSTDDYTVTYQVYRLEDGQWKPLLNNPQSETTYTDTGLNFGTEYSYFVQPYASLALLNGFTQSAGPIIDGEYRPDLAITASTAAPEGPEVTGVAPWHFDGTGSSDAGSVAAAIAGAGQLDYLTGKAQYQMRIEWATRSNQKLDGYEILRYKLAEDDQTVPGIEDMTLVGAAPANATSFLDTGLDSGRYAYAVRGYALNGGLKAYSGPSTAQSNANIGEVPRVSVSLEIATANNADGIGANFSFGGEIPENTRAYIWIADSEGNVYYTSSFLAGLSEGTGSYLLSPTDTVIRVGDTEPVHFKPGVEYTIGAAPLTVDGDTAYVGGGAVATFRAPLGITPELSSPTTLSGGAVQLEWTGAAGAEWYGVYRYEQGQPSVQLAAISATDNPGDGFSYDFVDETTEVGKTYTYYVRAFSHPMGSAITHGEDSGRETIIIPNPLPPTGVTLATTSNNAINISWTASTDTNVAGYAVYRTTSATAKPEAYEPVGTVTVETNNYVDSSTTPGAKYYYMVRSYATAGDGGKIYGAEYSAKAGPVTAGPGAGPTGFTAKTLNKTTIRLTWGYDSSNGTPGGFLLYRVTPDAKGNYKFSSPYKTIPLTDSKLENENGAYYYNDTVAQGTKYVYALKAYGASTAAANQSGWATDKAGAILTATQGVAAMVPRFPAPVITATATDSGGIELGWSAVSAPGLDGNITPAGYTVYLLVGRAWHEIGTVTDAQPITVSGLSPATNYTFKVAAYTASDVDNSLIYGLESAQKTVRTAAPTKELNPGSINTITANAKAITVTWSNAMKDMLALASNPTGGYDLYRWDNSTRDRNGNPVWTKVVSRAATRNDETLSHTVTGLTQGTTYSFILVPYVNNTRATDINLSSYDGYLGRHTIPKYPVVTITTASSVESDPQKATLTWSTPAATTGDAETPVAGYGIFRKTSKTAGWPAAPVAKVDVSVSSYTDTGLTQQTEYWYDVRAYGIGEDGTEIWGMARPNTDGILVKTGAMKAPENFTSETLNATTIRLSWDVVPDAAGYRIYRANTFKTVNGVSVPAFSQIAVVDSRAGITTYTYDNTGVKADTEYYYQVQALTKNGGTKYGALTAEDGCKHTIQLPAEPAIATYTSVSNDSGIGVQLQWAKVDAVKANGNEKQSTDGYIDPLYSIERKNGSKWDVIATMGNAYTTFTGDYTLTQGREYIYRVRAYYPAECGGELIYNSPAKEYKVKATAQAPAPRAFTASLTNSGTYVKLSWQNVEGNNGYRIMRRVKESGKDFAQLTTVNAGVTEYLDETAVLIADAQKVYNPTGYEYQVMANRAAPYGQATQTSVTIPLPATVSSANASVVNKNTILVTWKPADVALQYQVFRWEGKDAAELAANIAKAMPGPVKTINSDQPLEFKDTGRTAGRHYAYAVRAIAKNGGAVIPGGLSGYTRAIIPSIAMPAVTITPYDGPKTVLRWDACNYTRIEYGTVSTLPAAGYEVLRANAVIGDVAASAGQKAFSYADVTANGVTRYAYKVRAYAYGAEGEKIYSPEYAATITTGYAFADSVTISGGAAHLATGTSIAFKATTAASNGRTNGQVTWSVEAASGSSAYASITESGVLTALSGAGVVTVCATAKDGSEHPVSASYDVEIKNDAALVLNNKGVDTLLAGKSLALAASYLPNTRDISNKYGGFSWVMGTLTSASHGTITNEADMAQFVRRNGSTIIAQNGLTEDMNLTVKVTSLKGDPALEDAVTLTLRPIAGEVRISNETSRLELANSSVKTVNTIMLDLSKDTELRLASEIIPADAGQSVTWKSSSAAIASIDQHGVITAHKPGTVTITATADDGSRKVASFKLQTYYLDASARLTAQADIPKIGLEFKEKAQLEVIGSTTKEKMDPSLFTYSIPANQLAVATVDENGMITAGQKAGSATVTATLKDDPLKRKVSYTVRVIATQVEKISLAMDGLDSVDGVEYNSNGSELSLNKAAYTYVFTLNPTVALSNGEQVVKPALTWASSDTRIATIKANADGSCTVTVKANASGACIITATAKDLAKVQGSFAIHVRDYAPRLGGNRFELNTNYATPSVSLPLVESYDNEITEVSIMAYSNTTRAYTDGAAGYKVQYNKEESLLTLSYEGTAPAKNATTKMQLKVETSMGDDYLFDIQVVVKNLAPNFSTKQPVRFNSFYKDSTADIVIIPAKGFMVESVTFADTPDFTLKADDGQTLTPNGDGTVTVSGFTQEARGADGSVSIRVVFNEHEGINYNKLDTSAKLTVAFQNLKDSVTVARNISIATVKTQPKLTLSPASSLINTKLGGRSTTLTLLKDNRAWNSGIDGSFTIPTPTDANTNRLFHVTDNAQAGQISLTLKGAAGGTARFNVMHDNWTSPIALSHGVSVQTALPTLKLSSAILNLDRNFHKTIAQTGVSLSQANAELLDTFTYTALGSAAVQTQANKIKLAYNGTNNTITARIASPSNLPNAGTYSYTVTMQVENGTATPSNVSATLRVTVNGALPVVSFVTRPPMRLNQAFIGEEYASSVLKLNRAGYEISAISVATGANNKLKASDVTFYLDAASQTIRARLNNPNVAKAAYNYVLTATARSLATGQEVSLNPLNFSVQVYSGNATANVGQSGSLDAVQREDKYITYTLTGLSNVIGKAAGVSLTGEHAHMFNIEYAGDNTRGQPTYRLSLKEDMGYSTAMTYKFKLAFHLEGITKPVETAVKSVRVSQSAARLTVAPASNSLYQSSDKAKVEYDISLTSPAGSKLKGLAVNASTAVLLKQALGIEGDKDSTDDGLTIVCASDGKSATVTLSLKDASKLVYGRTYTLILDAYLKGNADNVKPTQIRLNLKAVQ